MADLEASAPASADVAQLTLRAVASGMVLGAVLSLCNIYSGLKIGWGTNMSITAALLGYAFWQLGQRLGKTSPFGIMENTVSQTAASAGASISSAGLVAPIPALTMLTGQTLAWQWLSVWVFSVACVGIVVGVGLRRQMLLVDKLPFPFGIATAETLKEMYARGAEAMARVRALLLAGGMAAALAIVKALETADEWDTETLISAMEGMSWETPKGTMTFRPEDHQALQSMYHFKIKVDDSVAWAIPELVREIKPDEMNIPVGRNNQE